MYVGKITVDFPGFARHLIGLNVTLLEMVMTSKRYAEEFEIEAVKQVTDRGYSVAEFAQRLGTTTHSLYTCSVHCVARTMRENKLKVRYPVL